MIFFPKLNLASSLIASQVPKIGYRPPFWSVLSPGHFVTSSLQNLISARLTFSAAETKISGFVNVIFLETGRDSSSFGLKY